jgi:hypothetical protein
MSTTEPASRPPTAPPPKRGGFGWLWLLLLLAALIVLILLLVRACGDDDGNGNNGGTAAGQVDAANGSGSLEAEGDDLLGAADGSLERFAGKDVDASQVEVQKVVNESGFWVGPNAERRVFVEVESDEEGSDVGLSEGDAVSFTGVIEQNIEAEDYGLRGDDAALYDRQGQHVRVQREDLETD